MILFTIRSATQPNMLMNMLTAVAGGWAFSCGAAGIGRGVATGVGGAVNGAGEQGKTAEV